MDQATKLPRMPEPPVVLPYSSLEYIKTDEALQAYADEAIRCALGDGWPFGLNKDGKGMSPEKLWRNYEHAIQVLNDLRVELTSCAKRIHNQRSEIGRLTFELAEAQPAREAAQSIEQARELSDEQIDRIADLVVKGMPDGIQGFCRSWGWRQFARAILSDCRGHVAAARSPQPTGKGGD